MLKIIKTEGNARRGEFVTPHGTHERDESLRGSAIGHYVDMQNRLYSKKRYLAALERFCLNEYDFYPKNH